MAWQISKTKSKERKTCSWYESRKSKFILNGWRRISPPHFRTYKEGTPHMIKSLKLVPMQPLDPDHADSIFKKWLPE